jgi:hypothetical protein
MIMVTAFFEDGIAPSASPLQAAQASAAKSKEQRAKNLNLWMASSNSTAARACLFVSTARCALNS